MSAEKQAQVAFKEMLKTQVAPAFRELGFKGTGQVYRLDVPDYWAMLGIQRSQWSDARKILFTLNLLCFAMADWNELRKRIPQHPERPNPNVFYAPNILWQRRIGELIPPTFEDTWWQVCAGRPTDGVADQVVAAVRDHALPAMRQQIAV